MSDMNRFVVRFEADTARFSPEVRRAEADFSRAAQGIEQRAAQVAARTSAVGARGFSGFSRGARATIGNVGQQIQDVAVQIEMGTSYLRTFAQQGPQIAGAFGPLGAVLGGVVAVGALVASMFFDVGSEAEEAGVKVGDFSGTASTLESALSGLEGSAIAYANAIATTGSTQSQASAEIVAATKEEFEMKKRLLALELERAEFDQGKRATALMSLEAAAKSARPQTEEDYVREAVNERRNRNLTMPSSRSQDTPYALKQLDRVGQEAAKEFNTKVVTGSEYKEQQQAYEEMLLDVKQIKLEAESASIFMVKAEKALSLGYEDIAKKAETRSKITSAPKVAKAKKKTRSSRPEKDFTEGARQQIARLEDQRAAVGVYGAELERLQARQNAARMEQQLLSRAMSDGTAVTEEERAQIVALKAEYMILAESVISAKEAENNRKEALKENAKAAEEARRAQERLNGQIMNGVLQAGSFSDMAKKLALNLADLAIQAALFGNGNGGGLIGSIFDGGGSSGGGIGGFLGDLAGSVFGSLAFAKGGVISGGSVQPFAKGAAFSGGKVTPFASGGVVSSPTLFPMKGGTGLMGEAGPEAIMPLKRGRDGKLGVAVSGGGGNQTVINVDARGARDEAATAAAVRAAVSISLAETDRRNADRQRKGRA